jgi:hypothetical protein
MNFRMDGYAQEAGRRLSDSARPDFSYISVSVTAPDGQTLVQVSQPSQSLARVGEALPSTMSKTVTGQLFTHSSQPVHTSALTATRYMMFPPLFD